MARTNTYEGFETFYNSFQMSFKMVKKIVIWTLFLYVLTGLVASFFYLTSYEKKVMVSYCKAQAVRSVPFNKSRLVTWSNQDGTTVRVPAENIAHNMQIREFIQQSLLKVKNTFLISLGTLVLIPLFFLAFKNKAGSQFKKKYIRGSKFLLFDEYEKRLKKNNESGYLPLGAWRETDIYGNQAKVSKTLMMVKIPVSCEPKHTAIIGRPGVGKTVEFSGFIYELKKKPGYKGITYCYKGDYVGKFFDPMKDLLFNPLDKRTLKWSIFNEIKTQMDIEMVAGSLFPTAGRTDGKEDFFINGAKDVFIGILYHLYHRGLTTNKDLWRYISLEPKDIVEILKVTPGGEAGLKAVGGNKGGQADGVFGTFMKHLKGFKYMAEMDGDFKIDDWLVQGEGVIYISNYENLKETLRPVLTLFIDLVGRRLLSMPDSYDRSIYFILDELHTLQKLSSIVELLTLVRSKGGKVIFGTQSFSQLDEIYGERVRHSMINSCGNSIIMALQDEKEAKIASEMINDIEYEQFNKTTSMGVSDFRDGISVAPQTKRERLVMPSQIKDLPELSAIVQLANYGLIGVQQEYKAYPMVNIVFDMRDELTLTRDIPMQSDPSDPNDSPDRIAYEPGVEDINYDEIAQINEQLQEQGMNNGSYEF